MLLASRAQLSVSNSVSQTKWFKLRDSLNVSVIGLCAKPDDTPALSYRKVDGTATRQNFSVKTSVQFSSGLQELLSNLL